MITIKVNQTTLDKIKEHYSSFIVPNDGEYIYFMADYEGLIITGYSSKKEHKSVTFNGNNEELEALKWSDNINKNVDNKSKNKEEWIDLDEQIGSDEVGVGDFLGPMIVVASYIKKEDIPFLLSLGVKDSKKLTDNKILEIAPLILEKIEVSKLTLPNEKYNEMLTKNENLNSLKAKMHNRALANLYKKHPNTKHIYVDQFVNVNKYFSYLNDKNEYIVKNITFKEKGESYYPSVAISSIIARYSFLKEMEEQNKKYNTKFPLGASNKVTNFAKEFIKKYNKEELTKIAKINFANFKEL